MTYTERDVWEFMSSYGISRESAIELLEGQEQEMSAGREHYERRIAQQRAADKRKVRRKADIDWKREEQ